MDEYLPDGVKEATKKRVVIVPEKQRLEEDFRHPSRYYVIDFFGNAIYLRTRDRATAKLLADEIYGEGFFTVKQVVTASVS